MAQYEEWRRREATGLETANKPQKGAVVWFASRFVNLDGAGGFPRKSVQEGRPGGESDRESGDPQSGHAGDGVLGKSTLGALMVHVLKLSHCVGTGRR